MFKKRGKNSVNGFLDNFIRYWYFFLSLGVILIFLLLYVFLAMQFSVGEVVYKKVDAGYIGVVKAVNLFDLGYVVFWNDGSYGSEKVYALGKIKDVPKFNNTAFNGTSSKYNASGNYNPGYLAKDNYINFYNTSKKVESFQDYSIESYSGEQISGIFYKGSSLGVNLPNASSCSPNFLCGEWSGCMVDYELFGLINSTLPLGIQYRYCEDKSNCLPAAIDSRKCDIGEKLVVKTIICNGKQIVLINNNGRVVARVTNVYETSKLNLNINLIGEEECNF